MVRRHLTQFGLLFAVLFGHAVAVCAGVNYEEAPISYSTAVADDPVSRLQEQVQSGAITVAYEPRHGYLQSLLKHLDIPVSSQVLPFAKVSVQKDLISPATPRAIYFNDQVHLGYVQNGLIEIAVADPLLGGVFYTVEQNSDGPIEFRRRTNACLTCHGAARTQNVPGFLVRSVFPDESGQPVIAAGSFNITHRSPIEQRWGGWYVTGTHGSMTHLGNFILADRKKPSTFLNQAGQNVTDLAQRFDTLAYPTPHSDLVALMVLEHQADTLNTLTKAGFEVRVALHKRSASSVAGKAEESNADGQLEQVVAEAADRVAAALLFEGEAPLTSPLSGTSEFAREFARRGPFDGDGCSLRQFDLRTRLFRYPVSYLIHTPTFTSLPDELKRATYSRLGSSLQPDSATAPLQRVSVEDRRVIARILEQTVSDWPASTQR